jgi:hypothetical protein
MNFEKVFLEKPRTSAPGLSRQFIPLKRQILSELYRQHQIDGSVLSNYFKYPSGLSSGHTAASY